MGNVLSRDQWRDLKLLAAMLARVCSDDGDDVLVRIGEMGRCAYDFFVSLQCEQVGREFGTNAKLQSIAFSMLIPLEEQERLEREERERCDREMLERWKRERLELEDRVAKLLRELLGRAERKRSEREERERSELEERFAKLLRELLGRAPVPTECHFCGAALGSFEDVMSHMCGVLPTNSVEMTGLLRRK